MTEYFAQAFYFKSFLNAACCKSVAKRMETGVLYFAGFKILFEMILHRPRLAESFFCPGEYKSLRLRFKCFHNVTNTLRQGYGSYGRTAFGFGDNYFRLFAGIFAILNPLDSTFYVYCVGTNRNIRPSERTQFAYPYARIKAK